MNYYTDIKAYCSSLETIDCHSHFRNEKNMSLSYILQNSYASWCNIPFCSDYKSRFDYIAKLKYNTYFLWLRKSLSKIYNLPLLTADNWDEYDNLIKNEYEKKPNKAFEIYDLCNIKSSILDCYWNPGFDHENSFFTPTFRINMFLFGYNDKAFDHNGNNANIFFNEYPQSFDEYILFTENSIASMKEKGCVALKCAAAYDRGLDFGDKNIAVAEKVYRSKHPSTEDIKVFQDTVMNLLCEICAKYNLTMQIHTGLGKMNKSSPLYLCNLIENNPNTNFSLMHGGYPFCHDLLGLIHNYKNVYADICWLPLISTSRALSFLEELSEVATADKIVWGTDTWTAEEAYGAKTAIINILGELCAKKIDSALWDIADAKEFCKNILFDNAKKLFYKF